MVVDGWMDGWIDRWIDSDRHTIDIIHLFRRASWGFVHYFHTLGNRKGKCLKLSMSLDTRNCIHSLFWPRGTAVFTCNRLH